MIFDAKPSVIGHRGYGAGGLLGYPENTPPAFTAAARAGATWVELDARRSSDGVLMVWHDPVALSGAPLIERTAADLAAEGLSRLTDLIGMLPAAVAAERDLARGISVAHAAGLEVMVWTVTPAQAADLATAGADALCVDDVPATLTALAAAGETG